MKLLWEERKHITFYTLGSQRKRISQGAFSSELFVLLMVERLTVTKTRNETNINLGQK